ncbi:sulfite exporter TauE/SafE family protein [Microbacterium sp. 22242]|uniref:sulfite exporter TauE/SafE family protein n=1 Tax=Microbacterium sp. 22242 TaxID=3453896 RepID=UPI003F878E50
MEPYMFLSLIMLGLGIGALTGLLGAGGGILAVPALVYLVGIPVEAAVSTSLVMGAIGPVAALVPRLRGGVDGRVALVVLATGVPAAFAGTAIGRLLPDDATMLAFALLMVASGVQMLRGRGTAEDVDVRPSRWIVRALAVGLLVGFLTGLLGIGGGFITVPALVFALGMPMNRAIGTSLVIAVVNSLAGIAAHAGTSTVGWGVALTFVIPSMAAAFLTARLARRVSNRVLQRSFAILVLAVAALTVLQIVFS